MVSWVKTNPNQHQQTPIIDATDLTKNNNKRVCWRLPSHRTSSRGGNARYLLLPTADIKQHEEEATERSGSETWRIPGRKVYKTTEKNYWSTKRLTDASKSVSKMSFRPRQTVIYQFDTVSGCCLFYFDSLCCKSLCHAVLK